jgi:CheY-like chemotaxis protein
MARKPIVLFVDDEPTTRRIYEYRFTLCGIPSYVVESAEAAIKVLEERKVDIVVTDLMMPKYDGTDLIVALRDCAATKNIPIILFTTGGNQDKLVEAVRAGATEVLPKHTTPPDRLIERLLTHTRDAIAREEAAEKR